MVLGFGAGLPGLDLLAGDAMRVDHLAVDDRRTADRANAAFDACQYLSNQLRSCGCLAQVANAFGQIVAKKEEVALELLLGPLLNLVVERSDGDRGDRRREDAWSIPRRLAVHSLHEHLHRLVG